MRRLARRAAPRPLGLGGGSGIPMGAGGGLEAMGRFGAAGVRLGNEPQHSARSWGKLVPALVGAERPQFLQAGK